MDSTTPSHDIVARTGDPLLPRHRHELEVGSGISPDVIANVGYCSVTAAEAAALGFAPSQCRPGLFMPTHTLAGVPVLGMLKPDEPRVVDGKPLKYEWPAKQPHLFDCPPTMLATLKTRGVPKWFTEGHKKAGAGASRGLACVNLPGVWTFLRDRLVVPDLDELELDGETCYVVFDSDVTRKRSVEQALLRFCEALRRRGAQVFVVYLPEGLDGAKVGLDDWFVAGGTVAELESLARPWDGQGPGVWIRNASEESPEALRATITTLMQAIENPENTRADLQLMASIAGQVMHKQSRGEVDANGKVVLSAAEISDDWRPAPPKGERVAPTNPTGTKPRMARERVGGLMGKAVERGLIQAKPLSTVRRHSNGTTYKTTDWVIDPAASFAELIDPWAKYRPAEPTQRKPRTIPTACPACGEVHAITRIDYCGSVDDPGCGAMISKPKVIAREQARETASDKLSEATDTVSSPPLVPIVRRFIGGAGHNTLIEPAWMSDAPEPASDDVSEPDMSPDDYGIDAPLLYETQEVLTVADHGDERARQDVGTQLERVALSRGRQPVPKPRREAVTPSGEAGDDYWSWA